MITKLGVYYDNHPDPAAHTVPIASPYRDRWWLPVLGPTTSCLLTRLAEHAHHNVAIFDTIDLATSLGLRPRSDPKSPLIRSLGRLIMFGFAHYDIEPGPDTDPSITLYRHCTQVPAKHRHTWSPTLETEHHHAWTNRHRTTTTH